MAAWDRAKASHRDESLAALARLTSIIDERTRPLPVTALVEERDVLAFVKLRPWVSPSGLVRDGWTRKVLVAVAPGPDGELAYWVWRGPGYMKRRTNWITMESLGVPITDPELGAERAFAWLRFGAPRPSDET